jgi:hypothetical protein
MDQDLADRLATVERAVTDGDTDLENVVDGAATADRVADLEARVDDLEDEVAEHDAAVQAVRGYVGEIRSINEEVEETAAAAMAKAERAVENEANRTPGPDAEGVAGTEAEWPAEAEAEWPAGTESERPAGTGDERTPGHDGESPAGTGAERAAWHDGERLAGTEAERAVGTAPAGGRAGDRNTATGRSQESPDPSTHPTSAATAVSNRAGATPSTDPSAGSCAGGRGSRPTGSCPACGRGAEEDAAVGPGSARDSGRSGGDRGLLDRVRDLL